MSLRLLAALALLSGLSAFAPAPEATVPAPTELIASADDDRCVWVGPNERICY